MDEWMKERFELAETRIREIRDNKENDVPEKFRDFFWKMADFICQMLALRQDIQNERQKSDSIEVLRAKNKSYYEDILPGKYAVSYANPVYAVEKTGKLYGQYLSFLYMELRGLIVFAFEKRDWDFLVAMELYLQVHSEFSQKEIPDAESVRRILYWYISDYCQDMTEYRIREGVDPSLDFAARIVMGEDLTNPAYLYQYGEYVTKDEERMAMFLASLPQEEIDSMARTFTEGYRMGFVNARIDLSKKKTVEIRYCLGFERMVRAAILQFEKMGLQPVMLRSAVHAVSRKSHYRVGYYGAIPNPQYDYDHRNDAGIFLDEEYVQRRLRATQEIYESLKEEASWLAGPAVIETFGEVPFSPAECEQSIRLNTNQQKLQVRLNNELTQIINRYIRGEEISFTIISYPVPAIGKNFESIFRETVKINTLDYYKYQSMQQKMIEVLDQGRYVHITGRNGNRTDIRVALHPLKNPEREAIFENCVADVNIPVGEVFTSPKLKGTNGLLHVKQVYLDSLLYRELEIRFTDGMISEYTCANFAGEEDNKAYIKENILYQHESLPLGEFAIGTNTTAYRVAKEYDIQEKFPILIAEKTGPHFAVGDTCFCWAEDNPSYNPDGKEVIARDNEVSLLRKTDLSKAYFNCHTDITIPYNELGDIVVEKEDGSCVPVIENGRFVVPGCEELNEEIDRADCAY